MSNEYIELPLFGINGKSIIYRETEKIRRLGIMFRALALENSVASLSYTNAILLESYYTATIEGARTTLEKVKAGRNKKDERMVRNCNKAITEISDMCLDLNNMIRMWHVIVDGVCENIDAQGTVFRNKMVYIGNGEKVIHTPMTPDRIYDAMEMLFKYYSCTGADALIKSIVMQFYIEYVHPMCDGNGRLGRLVTIWSLDDSGLHFMRYMPISKMINQNLKGYYISFIECEKVIDINGIKCIDLTPFIEFMLNIFISAVQEMNIRINYNLTELEKFILSKMSERGIGTEFSAKKCSDVLGIPIDLANEELNKLSSIGYLEKVTGAYRLKISI